MLRFCLAILQQHSIKGQGSPHTMLLTGTLCARGTPCFSTSCTHGRTLSALSGTGWLWQPTPMCTPMR